MRDKRVIAWALYDWANSAFATTVMAGFFPVFFKEYWSAGAEVTTSTFRLGVVNSVASVLVMIAAPMLGVVADHRRAKARFLRLFAFLGIVMTASLFWVAEGHWVWAVVFYGLGVLGFSGANIFYDALIVNVASPGKEDRVSSLGYALGYLGGGLLFALNVWMTLRPEWFGLRDASQAVRISFLTVAVWWGCFSIPLFLWVKESGTVRGEGGWRAIGSGVKSLMKTLGEIGRLPNVFLFLLAYWLYIDGVDTIIRMAVDYGLSLGFPRNSLILALLIVQFIGFPAALVFGRLGEKLGTKNGIFLGLTVYLGVTVWAFYMETPAEFYGLAVLVGLVQGGIQALSRSFYARLIPAERSGEFFGFYNMLGKFAAVIGPVMMGWVGVLTGSSRVGILSIALLFLAGGVLLALVREEPTADEGRRVAGR